MTQNTPIRDGSLWKNNKNGHVYQVLLSAVDVTNSSEGRHLVIYMRYDGQPPVWYAREREEFQRRFTPTQHPRSGVVWDNDSGRPGKSIPLTEQHPLRQAHDPKQDHPLLDKDDWLG